MKPQYIFFALMFLFAGAAHAQEPSEPNDLPADEFETRPVEIGVKAGANFSNLYMNGAYADAKIGGHAGVYFEIPISTYFAIQPELLFSQKGARYSHNNTNVNARFNYFDLPLMLEFKPAGNFSFQFGPQVSYLADVNLLCETSNPEMAALVYRICDSYNFNSFDFGFAGGFEYHLIKGYQIGLRYSHGLRPLENNKEVIVNGFKPEKTGANNSVFQFSLAMPL